MIKKLTIVIPAYKSRKLLINHIKNISKSIRIIIVDNSNNKKLKQELENKNNNVKVFLKKNIGYGRAINFGSKYVKTKYFLVINPDTKIYKNTITNLLFAAKKIKIFGAISPDQIDNKKTNIKKNLFEKRKELNGGAILFDTILFKKIKGFDENIFLYYEETDYFRKCNIMKYDLFLIKNSYFYHSIKGDSSSAFYINKKEKEYSRLIGGWHGQWSKFYYFKKYNGYFYSLLKCFPNLITNLIQLIIKTIVEPKKTKYIYFKIEGLLASIIGLPSFKRNKYDLFN